MKNIRARFAAFLIGFGFVASGVVAAATFNLFQPAAGILKGNPSTYITTAAASSDVISLWSGTCDASTFLKGDGSCGAALSGVVPVANGGTGVATLSGIVKGNGTSAVSSAASTDVISLWSGTCNSTTFLRADGSCQAAGGGSPANPTASLGLTAVNGSAATFMRSDAAPALSQSIVPTWTAQHTFTSAGAARNNAALYVNSATPFMRLTETDQVADSQDWLLGASSGVLALHAVTDAGTSPATAGRALQFLRTGTNISQVTFGNPTSNPSFTWSGSGAWNVGGGTGSSGQVLTSNGGSAAPTWQAAGGGGAAGSSTQVQYNVAGSFGADSGLTYGAGTLQVGNGLNVAGVVAADVSGLRVNTVPVCLQDRTGCPTGNLKFAFLRSSGITSCSTSNSSGVTSCTRTAAGTYSVSIAAAGYTTAPACTVSSGDTSVPVSDANVGGTTVVISTYPNTSTTATDVSQFSMTCIGI